MAEINAQTRARLLNSPNLVAENERMWSEETGQSLEYGHEKGERGQGKAEALDYKDADDGVGFTLG